MSAQLAQKIAHEGIESIGRYYGIYDAIVRDNADDENRGQLKLEIPAVWGAGIVPDIWAQMVTVAGRNNSFFQIPAIGQTVLVQFLDNGNPQYPIWIGSLMPPIYQQPEMNNDTALWARKKSKLVLRDGATSIDGATVVLGNIDNASNAAVLGNELSKFLSKLLLKLSVATVSGLPLSNFAEYVTMQTELQNILSQKVKLD